MWKRVFLQHCLPVIPPLQSHKHADVCAGSVVLCTDTSTLLTRASVRADRHKHTFLARIYLVCACVCVCYRIDNGSLQVCVTTREISRSGSNIWICANLCAFLQTSVVSTRLLYRDVSWYHQFSSILVTIAATVPPQWSSGYKVQPQRSRE